MDKTVNDEVEDDGGNAVSAVLMVSGVFKLASKRNEGEQGRHCN